MAKMAYNTLVVAIVMSFVAVPAPSRDNNGGSGNSQWQNYHGGHDVTDHEIEHYHGTRDVSAPEIDPGQALGALMLLSGTVAIIRGYRRRK